MTGVTSGVTFWKIQIVVIMDGLFIIVNDYYMDSKTIVETYGAKVKGQPLLWEDHDFILRQTPFQAVNPEFDRLAIIHWSMNIYKPGTKKEDEGVDYEVWKTWDRACDIFKNVSRQIGYNSSTNQQALGITMTQNQDVKPAIDEFKMWFPHYKPLPEENTKVWCFHVADNDLSEHGVLSLKYYSEQLISLDVLRYGHTSRLRNFTSLHEAFVYLAKNHWLREKNDT